MRNNWQDDVEIDLIVDSLVDYVCASPQEFDPAYERQVTAVEQVLFAHQLTRMPCTIQLSHQTLSITNMKLYVELRKLHEASKALQQESLRLQQRTNEIASQLQLDASLGQLEGGSKAAEHFHRQDGEL